MSEDLNSNPNLNNKFGTSNSQKPLIAVVIMIVLGISSLFYANIRNISKNVPGLPIELNKNNQESSLVQKLNAYVDLLNYVSEDVYTSFDSYANWLENVDAGPTGNEQKIYGIYKLNDYSHYMDAATKAYDLEPKIDLDKDFEAYKKAYIELKPVVAELYTYYDQQNYKDDNFEKGKSMHQKYLNLFDTFDLASYQLDVDYEKADLKQRKIEIEDYKNTGRILAYDTSIALMEAQTLYFSIRDQLKESKNDASKLNTDGLAKGVAGLESSLEKLKKDQNNKTEIEKEYGVSGVSKYNSFLNSYEKLLSSAKILARGLKDNNLPARDNYARTTEGTPEYFVETYNEMIDSFNFMTRY